MKLVTRLLLALGLVFSAPLLAQDIDELRDTLADTLKLVQGEGTLEPEKRDALLERLRSVEGSLDRAEKEQARFDKVQNDIATADEAVSDYQGRARDIEEAPATLEQRLGAEPDLAAIESELGLLENQRAQWGQDRKKALDALAGLADADRKRRQRVTELEAALESASSDEPAASDDSDASIDALAAQAERLANETEVKRLRLELREGAALSRIRSARIAWLDAAIAESDRLLKELQEAASANRKNAAVQRNAEIRRTLGRLTTVPASIQATADRNLSMARRLQSLSTDIDQERSAVSSTREQAERIQQDANLTQRRLDVARRESRLGEVMLTRLAALPDVRAILAQTRLRDERIANLSISAIDTEQALRQLSGRSSSEIDDSARYDGLDERERQVAVQLHQQRRQLLQDTLQAENSLLRLLIDHNQATQTLAGAAAEYKELLTAELLWVRSYAFAAPEEIRTNVAFLRGNLPFAAFTQHWRRFFQDPLALFMSGTLAVLLLRRKSTRAYLQEVLSKPIRPSEESKALILRSLAATLLRVLPRPLLLLLIAHACTLFANGDRVVLEALHEAFLYTGLALLYWRFMEALAQRLGAGRRLLKWNSQKLDAATRDLRWARPILALALFITLFGRGISPTNSGGAIAAVGSFTIAVVTLFMVVRALRSHQFDTDALGLLCLRGAALLCAAIVIMHVSGQLFAAHLYLLATGGSIVAVLSVLLVANVIQRMLLIYRLRLAREQREEQRARESESADASVEPAAEADDTLDVVTSLSDAYARLIGVFRLLGIAGLLWLIWSPALPALNVFEAITLWSVVDSSLPAGELRDVTLATAMLAVVVVAITLFLTRHFPPMLNVMLLEWTSVTPGGRYASGMLMQYLIIGVGLSSALVMLGFRWSEVQWLVAALGVGIGFGLQEIVANFISGLIVLFERPIRVGDIINAGGFDGTVTRINPRATVIETFEGKEVMVPNKELITNAVTNWSLSSSRLRVVVPIGVAYGSDVGEAMRLLKQAAVEHPEILDDPEPFVTFEDFGDNALILWLRCYALKDYLRLATELRGRIYDVFNEAGLSIAFPQRDLHLDATAPIPVEVITKPSA